MHFLRVALLVSVITTLLPKRLHAAQQQSGSSKALLNMEKKRGEKKRYNMFPSHNSTPCNFHVLTAIKI